MASILRSVKFLRYFAGLTRNVVVNSVRDNDAVSLVQNSACMCNQYQHGFATDAATKNDLNLDKQLRRLDQDVRRIGRISRRDIEDVLEEIRTQRSATSSQSLLVIRCCGNLVPEELPEVRTTLVQEIWKTLNALNVPMDISHYNALLRVYLENEHKFSPTEFLAEIESKSIEPNRVTYQRLILRYCQEGDIEGATRILEFMRSKKLPVNENVFNSLILGHSQANDLESAKGILGVMKQTGLEASADTYTTLLCCYARHGDQESILNTISECEKNEIFLLDKDFLDVVYHLAINGHGDKVDQILEKLRFSMGFNQDAANIILRLVNKGQEDVGLKILRLMPRSTRPNGQLVDAGSFFIKQLVKVNRPIEKIVTICKTLQDEGLNPRALLIATEAGLIHGVVNNAIPLLNEMKNAGLPIRQHYFWPLICAVQSNQVIDVLRRMQNDFSISPNSETIRDYVIPNLKEKNLEKMVAILRDAGIPNAIAASAVASSALVCHRMDEAASIMESCRIYYAPHLFRQPLLHALAKTNNYDAYIRIVRQLFESTQNRHNILNSQNSTSVDEELESNENVDVEASVNAIPDIVGSVLLDISSFFQRNRVDILETILSGFVAQGLSISSNHAIRLSDRIGSDMNPRLSELLVKLTSGDLELLPIANSSHQKRSPDQLTIEELERFIANVESKGDKANNLKRHLLNACYRVKNIEKMEQVIEKLESENFIIHGGGWAQLFDLYTHHSRSNDAILLFDKLKSKNPEFILDNLKTMRFVDLLIKEDRLQDALKFLEKNKNPELSADTENSYNYTSLTWRTLNALAEKGDAQNLETLFNALVEGNYIVPNNVLLGPLIKVHLVNDNISKAVESFEKICETYKSTPWKNELACRLIQKEDAVNLQKVTDLSTNIHGEINSLYDLVFSFVECGRVRQARKILETPGLKSRAYRIENACERYNKEGMVESLEGLVEATKDLNHIDRNKIFHNLLLSYVKTDDAEKGLGLWTKMQDENILPTDIFLTTLAKLLKKNNMKIPFTSPVDNISPTKPKVEKKVVEPTKSIPANNENPKVTPSTISLLRKCINAGDVDTAIIYHNELQSKEQLNIVDTSKIIELLVRSDRLTEATKYVERLLTKQLYPLPKIFRYYLNKIAAAGDVETMVSIGEKLSDEEKKLISYDNRFCHTNIVAGKTEQYFKNLDNEISAVKTDEEASKLAEKFPRGGALGILEKHPEMVPQFEALAEKYAALKQLGPINVLWMHLISKGDEAGSKKIWDKHLSNAPRLMFQRVLQTAREQKDTKLAESVINQLRGSKISEGAIGNSYSCLIDIQVNNGNYDKALETLNTAMKDVCLEHINRTALQRLQAGLVEQKKEFPYTLPEKKSKTMSSSSTSSQSSDDDVTPKRPETIPSKPQE